MQRDVDAYNVQERTIRPCRNKWFFANITILGAGFSMVEGLAAQRNCKACVRLDSDCIRYAFPSTSAAAGNKSNLCSLLLVRVESSQRRRLFFVACQ